MNIYTGTAARAGAESQPLPAQPNEKPHDDLFHSRSAPRCRPPIAARVARVQYLPTSARPADEQQARGGR
eukprot:COSAG06_NODE_37087_length_439_cov_1.214706_2_plen_69_part_01